MNILKKIFNRTEIEYNRLIKSEEYLQSKWRIRYIKNEKHKGYTLYDRNNDTYLDLVSTSYFSWKYSDRYFKDCVVSSKHTIVKALTGMLTANNEPLQMSDEERLNEFDIKVIEQYLRKKKLEKMK